MDYALEPIDFDPFADDAPPGAEPVDKPPEFDNGLDLEAVDFDPFEDKPEFSAGRLASQAGRGVAQGVADVARFGAMMERGRDIEADTERTRKAESGEAPAILAAMETPATRATRAQARSEYYAKVGAKPGEYDQHE